ncbi:MULTISPECIES: hypothetical protein [unclassified Staphylococcus]|uniref:hypothetical protein n=1 Tax=unclassified Staphylococcus TaxID=91994 RepID=UPI0021D0CCEF|nr:MULTISPECIES: hypothetical protein [unclassified Staphylococcus]UXR71752.1 hypothetical protein MUA88_00645 [Staphylococcus sp. IVB6240]UXR74055.1 hypothetical protein MUA48_00825 [Staphylococcus sp. IVB6238]UXR76447.1 hypothetical protein MUA74_01185 [Staphylococcus sp. IVB6233]UXR80574.1 hypothetical protein MUA65_00795 [Staphylococcus sp. IVB6218]
MKKVLGILTTTALVATLAACSNGDNGQNNQANNAGQNNENQANQSQSNNNNTNGNNQSNNQNNGNTNQTKQKNLSVEEAVQNLTDEERVALALYDPNIKESSITANDMANGQFTQIANGPAETARQVKPVSQITLTPETKFTVPGAPSDLRLYKPYPQKTIAAVCFVAVTDDQVILYATQYNISYNELLNENNPALVNVNSVKDLYSKYSNQDYKGLASRIVIGPEPPEAKAPQTSSSDSSDSDESESSSSSSSTSGTTVTRANVIDLVEDYEGHLLDTDTYTYKEPAQLDDGSWGFSFLDKSGNLAGSYIVSKDGTVTKYDEKGIEE